jgi:phage-related protein
MGALPLSLRFLQGQGGDFDLRARLRQMYRLWYNTPMSLPRIETRVLSRKMASESLPFSSVRKRFGEPVREWLKSLSPDDRKRIGEDIKSVEFGWPIGMPVCRPMGEGIYEVRTRLNENRIARVLFYIDKRGRMVLLHGFIKKTSRTPDGDLALARANKSNHIRGLE